MGTTRQRVGHWGFSDQWSVTANGVADASAYTLFVMLKYSAFRLYWKCDYVQKFQIKEYYWCETRRCTYTCRAKRGPRGSESAIKASSTWSMKRNRKGHLCYAEIFGITFILEMNSRNRYAIMFKNIIKPQNTSGAKHAAVPIHAERSADHEAVSRRPRQAVRYHWSVSTKGVADDSTYTQFAMLKYSAVLRLYWKWTREIDMRWCSKIS